MATVYSGEVAPGGSQWNRIRLKCDYSGTSATLTIQFRRTSGWTDHWADTSSTLTFNGRTASAPYDVSGYVDTNWRDIITVWGYTISTAGGTYGWDFGTTQGGVLACSGTITIPAQGSGPSNGYINGLSVAYSGTELVFSATAVGVNDGGLALNLTRFEITKVPLTTSGIDAQCKNFTNGQPITISQTDSYVNHNGVTIIGNGLFYAGFVARNSVDTYYYSGHSIVTPCVPATISVASVTESAVSVSYSTVADGGYYDKTIQYSLDGGTTWVDGITLTGSSAQTGTFTILNLSSSTAYTLKTRMHTTAGDTNNADVTFTTGTKAERCKILGSVNSSAERINLLYGSENGQSTRIIKVYGPEQVTINVYSVTDIANNTGFNASTFMSKYNAEYGDMTDEPTGLTIGEVPIGSGDMKAFLRFTQGVETKMLFTWTKDNYNGEGTDWGFASEPVTGLITSTSTTQTGYQTRRVF